MTLHRKSWNQPSHDPSHVESCWLQQCFECLHVELDGIGAISGAGQMHTIMFFFFHIEFNFGELKHAYVCYLPIVYHLDSADL